MEKNSEGFPLSLNGKEVYMIGFVIVIIMFAIIFALIGISYRNDFIVRKEDINKCRSNERLKRQQYLDAAKRVKALAKEFVGIDTKANVEMINANNNGSNFFSRINCFIFHLE